MQDEHWFEAHHDETRFVALAECDNIGCKEVATVAGVGSVEEVPDWEAQRMGYENVFHATFVEPSPPLIRIPSECPSSVVNELKLAANRQWSDPAASANHIRIAAERLLDARRIPKTKPATNGRTRLTLHQRIELFTTKFPTLGAKLLATKWLGNAGAHTNDLTRENVFEMFDIMESVVVALYGKDAQQLEKLVAAVNKAKGPTR